MAVAGAMLLGSVLQSQTASQAAGRAASAQERSAAEATAEHRRQFDIMQQQALPYRQSGLSALNLQRALMGLPQVAAEAGGEAVPQFTREQAMATLTEMPGQQFMRERQQQALLRSSAALGGLGGGQVRTDLQRQAAGFAQQDLQSQLARLSALSGMGAQMTRGVGAAGMQMAGNVGQLMTQAGQARAGGILGQSQAQQQMLSTAMGGLGGAYMGSRGMLGPGVSAGGGALMGLMSDERLKQDVTQLDLKACYDAMLSMDLKAWKYLNEVGLGEEVHLGPMAQDAPDMIKLQDMTEYEKLNLHDELMMIAGALQYMKNEGMLNNAYH